MLDGAVVGGVTIALVPGVPPAGPGGPGGVGPYRFGVATGGNWPVGGMRREADPAFHFSAGLERVVRPWARLGLEAGYHAFDEDGAAGGNLGVTRLSLAGRLIRPSGTVRPFALVGPGAYRVRGSWEPGVLAGVGLEVPVTPAVALTTGATYHWVDARRPRPQGVSANIGFVVAVP